MTAGAAPSAEGYTTRLAARHLVSGLVRPREAMREALAAGLGERGRIAIVWLSVWPIALSDRELWRIAVDLQGELAQELDVSFGIGVVLAALAMVALSLVVIVAYLFMALVATTAMTVLRQPGRSFVAARSAVALGSWIMVLPTVAVQLLAGAVLPEPMISADPPSLYSSIGFITFTPYLAFCLAEVTGSPLPRPLAVALVTVLVTALVLVVAIQGSNALSNSPAAPDAVDGAA